MQFLLHLLHSPHFLQLSRVIHRSHELSKRQVNQHFVSGSCSPYCEKSKFALPHLPTSSWASLTWVLRPELKNLTGSFDTVKTDLMTVAADVVVAVAGLCSAARKLRPAGGYWTQRTHLMLLLQELLM